jgi:hypothetical protein
MPWWIREIVLINAVVYLAFGVALLLFPAALARLVDIELRSPSAFADLRAIYGGLATSVGLLFALGLRREGWFLPSLFLVMASSAGLALGRIYSVAVSGTPGTLVLIMLATEVGSFVWAALGYRALAASDPVAPASMMPSMSRSRK